MASSARIEQAAAAWLARRDSGDWPAAVQAEFEAWLQAATAHRVAFLRLQAAWQESGRLAALGAGLAATTPPPRGQWPAGVIESAAAAHGADPVVPAAAPVAGPPDLARLVFAPRRRDPARRTPLLAAVAAALLLAVTLLGLGWRYGAVEQAGYRTATGELRELRLGDGSQVTLSSDSRIQVRFSRRERHIDLLRGEAFFAVRKDRRRPFVIAAGRRHVVAVGTAFAVRRSPAELRVVVTHGLVRLDSGPNRAGQPQPSTLLPAGSVAVANSVGIVVRSGPVAEAERQLDWRSGFLDFRDTSLAEAAAEFNRYNTRKLVLGDDAVAALRVGGHFRWSNLDTFVRLLELGFPVRVEAERERIVLHSR